MGQLLPFRHHFPRRVVIFRVLIFIYVPLL